MTEQLSDSELDKNTYSLLMQNEKEMNNENRLTSKLLCYHFFAIETGLHHTMPEAGRKRVKLGLLGALELITLIHKHNTPVSIRS